MSFARPRLLIVATIPFRPEDEFPAALRAVGFDLISLHGTGTRLGQMVERAIGDRAPDMILSADLTAIARFRALPGKHARGSAAIERVMADPAWLGSISCSRRRRGGRCWWAHRPPASRGATI